MRKIAVEEHFHGPYYHDYVQARKGYPRLQLGKDAKGEYVWR